MLSFFAHSTPPKVCCLVVKLMRGSGAEKDIFERRCRTRFLMDQATVKNVDVRMYIVSNV